MRILPERHDDKGGRAPRKQPEPHRRTDQSGLHHVRRLSHPLPLWNLQGRHRVCSASRLDHGEREAGMTIKRSHSIDVFGATLSRRQFVKTSGVLAVGISMAGPAALRGDTPKAAVAKNSLDPSLASSWLEIHEDNTVTIRTGKSDFGQGSVYTSYRQIVAEELSMPFEAVCTVVTGSTDQTPDGGGSFGFLNDGTPNLRKVAAYTYQALLDLAATKLGVAKDKLTVRDGVVSGGGKSISYGD